MNRRAVEAVADQVLAGVHHDGDVVAGPMMWRPSDGIDARAGYFSVATRGDAFGFQVHRIAAAGIDERERIISAMIRRGTADVWPLHCDDGVGELHWMGVVDSIWPGELARLRDQRRAAP
jgi:hypothetical protein